MKTLIKSLTPPILWNFIRKKVTTEVKNTTYEGIYSSFQEVLDNFTQSSTEYNSPESAEQSYHKAKLRFSQLKSETTPNLSWENSRLNLFPAFLATQVRLTPLSILDIGGGLGVSYVDLKSSCPNIKVDYTIYELPEVAKQGEQLSKEINDLKFVSDLPQYNRLDCVLFGSSLQYFENYAQVIDKVCSNNPDYVVLTDHPMGYFNSFICAQVNMKDRVIPRFVFNIDEIVSLFNKNKYKLILKSLNFYPFHNFENYTGPESTAQHYNLIFKKEKNCD